ncbi:hypothetical protein GXW82_44635 [Streptacidiphilus sp. 4-A2]|nr:hypothetical protein [Streptacidiphilus sp. 4-A2]
MATKKKSTATTEDVATTKAAVVAYFNGEVDRRRAELEAATKNLADAEARRSEIAGGARMTLTEYVCVHSVIQDQALELAKDLIDGRAGGTREDYQALRDQADAVKRGLVADGYTEVELS